MVYTARYFKPFTGTQQVIGTGAVTAEKILPGAVDSLQLKDKGVQSADIADGAVLLRHLGPDVPAVGIPNGSITEDKLANDSVSAAKIKTGAVTSTELGAGAVTVTKLGDASVETVKIKDGVVTPSKLDALDAPADQEVPVYDNATGRFEWKAPAGGGVQMRWGTYTGDGNPTQSIFMVPITPKHIMVYARTLTPGGYVAQGIKTDNDGVNSYLVDETGNANYATDGIVSFEADGFTVGLVLNLMGIVYTYVVFG